MPTLTAKQQGFVDAILAGSDQSTAYRQSYAAKNMSADAIKVEACRLAASPNVALTIAQGRERLAERRAWDLERLVERAEHGMDGAETDKQWGSYSALLQFIGKATGLVADKHAVEHNVQVSHQLATADLEALPAMITAACNDLDLPLPFSGETKGLRTPMPNAKWLNPADTDAKTVDADDYKVA